MHGFAHRNMLSADTPRRARGVAYRKRGVASATQPATPRLRHGIDWKIWRKPPAAPRPAAAPRTLALAYRIMVNNAKNANGPTFKNVRRRSCVLSSLRSRLFVPYACPWRLGSRQQSNDDESTTPTPPTALVTRHATAQRSRSPETGSRGRTSGSDLSPHVTSHTDVILNPVKLATPYPVPRSSTVENAVVAFRD